MFDRLLAVGLVTVIVCAAEEPPRVGVGVIERKLSLSDALAMALKNNLEIELERTNIATARQAVRAAQGAFDFVVRFQPSYEFRNTPTASVLAAASGRAEDRFLNQNGYVVQPLPWGGGTAHLDFINARQTTNNPFVGLTPFITSQLVLGITQPLVRGHKIDPQRAEIRIRSKQVGISEVDLELRVIDVATRVMSAYWDLVAARQDVKVKGAYVEWAREQLARTKRSIEAGTLAQVELSASEAEVERRQDTYLSAVGLVTEIENNLKTLLAGDRRDEIWGDILIPTDENAPTVSVTDDYRAAVNQAVGRRPELRQITLRRETNDIQKNLAQNQTKPLVNLIANYVNSGLAGSVNPTPNPFTASNTELYTRVNQLASASGLPPVTPAGSGAVPGQFIGSYGQTLLGLFGGNYQGVLAGVQLEWNPRNRSAEATVAQTVVAERRLALLRTQAEQVVEAQVRTALQTIQTAKQRIGAAEASARAAKEKMESEIRLFQSGESTNFLVLTRQNEYADSLHRVVVARSDLNKALARWEQSLGSTLETYGLKIQ